MTIGQTAPVNPEDRFAQTLATLARRIEDLERQVARPPLIPTYTNGAARDAAIPAPKKGMVALLTATGQLTVRNDTTWVVI